MGPPAKRQSGTLLKLLPSLLLMCALAALGLLLGLKAGPALGDWLMVFAGVVILFQPLIFRRTIDRIARRMRERGRMTERFEGAWTNP